MLLILRCPRDVHRSVLSRLQNSTSRSAAVVITRPPEIVCILKVVVGPREIFVLFDSHPREDHRDGAAFVFYSSMNAAADYLSELFKYDQSLLDDPATRWQAQLLNNFSGHAFVVEASTLDDPAGMLDAVLESSLESLSLKAEIVELERTKDRLQAQVDHLTEENIRLEDEVINLRPAPLQQHTQSYRTTHGSFADAQRTSSSHSFLPASSSKGMDKNIKALPAPPPAPSSTSKGKMVMRSTDERDDNDFFIATRIQLEWQAEVEQRDASSRLAAQKQKEFDQEDRRLRAQMVELQSAIPVMFNCGVCLEEHSEFVIARIDPCGHEFCRDCVRSHIKSKLAEHRFPILCPICAADKDKADPGGECSLRFAIAGVLINRKC